ncbi:hypothetical protein Pla52n_19340 [Stieleria varia]|uniref:Uncharacterized protein n=1 Tax=Stieleria varia TaxID=2528005 RepID=A0A5C6B6R1_9BACT|nr:hypothetical protein Pla52n_19340 [Stieleria varia]
MFVCLAAAIGSGVTSFYFALPNRCIMNLVRSLITVFLIALFASAVAGWIWAGGQPSPKMEGSRVVLAICALSSIGCFVLIWRAKPGESQPTDSLPVDAT